MILARDTDGNRCLMTAIKTGNLETARFLVNKAKASTVLQFSLKNLLRVRNKDGCLAVHLVSEAGAEFCPIFQEEELIAELKFALQKGLQRCVPAIGSKNDLAKADQKLRLLWSAVDLDLNGIGTYMLEKWVDLRHTPGPDGMSPVH